MTKHDEVRVGLIGLGTVGKGLARAIADEVAGHTALGAVLVKPHNLDAARHFLREIWLEPVLTSDPEDFFEADITLVVEVAGQEALRQYAARALQSQRDLLVCATGAFTDDALLEELKGLAIQYRRRLIIPSGAIAGIDALTSAALAGVDEVTITTRKPPLAWLGTAAEDLTDLRKINGQPVCLFDGPAREAARLFPHSVNVAATLACAGIGLDHTRALVYADPSVTRNVHQISIRGKCGEINIEVSGQPSPENPRTSTLTAYSVIKTVRNLTAPIVIG